MDVLPPVDALRLTGGYPARPLSHSLSRSLMRAGTAACCAALAACVLAIGAVPAAAAPVLAPDPRFTSSHVAIGTSTPVATAIGDVTGDGLADLIVATGGGGAVETDHRVFVFEQGPSGDLPATPTFSVTPSASSEGYVLAVGDLNHDGNGDLAVAAVAGTPASGIDVFLESGGTLGAPSTISPVAVKDLAVADMNGDGRDDLVYSTSGFSVVVRPQLVLGGFGEGTTVASGVPNLGLSLGDVDDDGLTDFAIDGSANESLPVFLQDPTLHTFARTDVPLSVAVTRAFLADVNHDGMADLVVAQTGGTGLAWAAGAGDATFGSFTSVGGPSFDAKEIGDLNDDGLTDVATFRNGVVRIYVQQNAGGLAAPCSFPATDVTGGDPSTAVGDLAGDGAADLAGAEGVGEVGGATVFTQLAGGQKLATSLSLALSASTIGFGSTVTLSGALSSPEGGCVPSGSVTIHQRDPHDVESVIGTAPLGADLSFSIDVAPAGGGDFAYWGTWAGDGTHDAATSPERDVTVTRGQTSLSLTPSASTVEFGRAVTLRADLAGSVGSPTVNFFRFVDGTKAKIGSATANEHGVAKLTIEPSRNADYRAVFSGNGDLTGSASAKVTVNVRVVVIGSMVHADDHKGDLAIYDCCKAFYRFVVKPKHPGGIVTVAVQYLSGGRWHDLPSPIDTFKLGSDGTDQIFLHVAGGRGYTFRVRSHFASDADHLGAWSSYVRFRFR